MTLRAGLVGLGSMGRNHARVLRSMDGVRLVGVVDPQGDPDRAVEPVPVHRELASLIEAGVDFCVVASPTESHHRVGMALARAGVHALIEKPLAADSAQAEELAAEFSRRGLVGAVGHVERFNPAILQMRARLAAGDIGEVYQVATRRQGPYPVRICDVGVVMDLATHDLDLTAFVTRSRYADVSARTAHRSGREHEDLVAVVGSLADGTIVSHLVNWLSPLKERVTVATGERGTLVADTVFGDLTRHENGVEATQWDAIAAFRGVTEGDVTRFAIPKHEPLRRELEAMRDAVLGVGGDIVSLVDGAGTVAVAEALLTSARIGAPVRPRGVPAEGLAERGSPAGATIDLRESLRARPER